MHMLHSGVFPSHLIFLDLQLAHVNRYMPFDFVTRIGRFGEETSLPERSVFLGGMSDEERKERSSSNVPKPMIYTPYTMRSVPQRRGWGMMPLDDRGSGLTPQLKVVPP